jgi:TDG/mug DNA glycosylase family protein
MEELPDLVGAEPLIVFCGLACAESTTVREHYYAGGGNSFWQMLHRSGLAPSELSPEQDESVVGLGLGLTDLVRHGSTTPPTWDVDDLVAKVERWQPEWLAFTSKTVAQGAARALGLRKPQLGVAEWELAGVPVFVLPGTSGANQRKDYDGRPDRLSWWRDLAALAQSRELAPTHHPK